jgi:hypothetical protein
VALPENDFLKEIVGASRREQIGSVKDKYRQLFWPLEVPLSQCFSHREGPDATRRRHRRQLVEQLSRGQCAATPAFIEDRRGATDVTAYGGRQPLLDPPYPVCERLHRPPCNSPQHDSRAVSVYG